MSVEGAPKGSKKSIKRIVLPLAIIGGVVLVVGGIVGGMILLPWMHSHPATNSFEEMIGMKPLTFAQVKDKVNAYSAAHSISAFDRTSDFNYTTSQGDDSRSHTIMLFRRSDEYLHIDSTIKDESSGEQPITTTSDRYALKDRPLVLMKFNSDPVAANRTDDPSLNGGSGYRGYGKYEDEYNLYPRGILNALNTDAAVVHSGHEYHVKATAEADKLYAAIDPSYSTHSDDTRQASVEVIINDMNYSITSFRIALTPDAQVFGHDTTENEVFSNINYAKQVVTLPADFTAALKNVQ